ncbi:MAG: hypothetical protein Q8Q06_00295 [bacterium]|nr:hypothetical protein [bacterium]
MTKKIKNKKRITVAKPKSAKPAGREPRYVLNREFELFYELRELILKSVPAEKSKIVERLNKVGRVRLILISGIFLNKENDDASVPDLFMVIDDVDSRKLKIVLKSLEAEVGKEIKFAIMDRDEFTYRLGMFDRFIRVLLEGPHEKLLDKIGLEQNAAILAKSS